MLRYRFLAGLALVWSVSPTLAQSPGEDVPTQAVSPSEAAPPRPIPDMSALGGGMMGMGGSTLPGGTYRTTWLPSQGVNGQSAKLGVVQQDLSASCPL